MRSSGHGLVDLLAALVVLGLGVALVVPALAHTGSVARTGAAARYLALELSAQRWTSVASARGHGLWFRKDSDGWYWVVVQDGNGNGLRTAEVTRGVDRIVSAPARLDHRVAGVRIGLPRDEAVPRIPPAAGVLDPADPVQFGRSDLVAFAPQGSSSSGTLYVSDEQRGLFGVVLFGRTGKVRVWRYDRQERRWRD